MPAEYIRVPSGIDLGKIERQLGALAPLGRSLWLPAIINSEGAPFARIETLLRWRARLLAGCAPIECDDRWPEPDVAEAFGRVFETLQLAALARAQASVVEQVMRSVLWHLDRIALALAHLPREHAVRLASQAFEADWLDQRRELEQVLRVFDSLDGVSCFASGSALRGLLRSESWQAVLAAHEHIEQLPALRRLIQALGRTRPLAEFRPDIAISAVPDLLEAPQWLRQLRARALPGAALETEGVRRAGDIAQILPSEALQLRRRTGGASARSVRRLKLLFAARLVEQTLLSYQRRDWWQEPDWVRATGTRLREDHVQMPKLEAGPVIVCVDTSSSMAGGPEAVAKAVVLETTRIAAAAKRPCLIYAFSGPGELRLWELKLDLHGIASLASFLAGSFHGGTDIVEPVESALAQIETSNWRQADLLIASDGEFGPTPALVQRLAQARRRLGLRIQGVLIGDRETMGLRQTCDDIFWVRDWRRFGLRHGQEQSPVHDRRLTQLYFPNATARPGVSSGPNSGGTIVDPNTQARPPE